eukprot:TRINITY_DN15158_c0_g1_i3.p1 TRINITY_DN15158_c0_g1~~TRINITY_DN15158_c0_g1_i3.p1  ORF type:complete len:209 (-),score=17.90 TRINITY_DN15158_c0_g1_i3:320-946(-)
MECWVKLQCLSHSSETIFYHGDGRYMTALYYMSNQFYLMSRGSRGSANVAATPSAGIPMDKWIHIAATYEISTQTWSLYVNGTLASSLPMNQCGPVSSAAPWLLGSSSQYPFQGQICDARIWKVARTDSQIRSTMKKKPKPDAEGLVGFWPLQDGLGLSVKDMSSYNNPGFLSHCTWEDGEHPRSEERFSRNAETDLVCRLLLEKKKR